MSPADLQAEYTVKLTDSERISIEIALKNSLAYYKSRGYTVEAAPAGSTIGQQRDLLAGLQAIGLGNRRGSDKFQLRMVAS